MAKYQVRVWDSFYNDYTMIPVDFDNCDDAINHCIGLSEELDLFGESQVWIECLGGTAWQMVGYADDSEFVECFG